MGRFNSCLSTLPSLYFVEKESVHDTYKEKNAEVEAEAGHN